MFNDPSKLVIEQCSSLVTVTDAGSHHFQKVNYLWAENGSVMGVATLHVVACTTVTSRHHMGVTMLHVVACTIVTSHHCMGVAMLYVVACTTVTSHHRLGVTMLHVVACSNRMGVAMHHVAAYKYGDLTSLHMTEAKRD